MKKLTLFALSLTAVAAFSGAAHAEVATYALDPSHTFASFEIGHMGTSTIRARFDKKEGTAQLNRAAKTGKLDVTIDTSSVSSGVEQFNKHLQSADLLDVAKHPTATFVSDKFVFSGDKVTEITGTLTLLGKSQPLTLKATRFNCYMNPMFKREVCGGDFEASFKRSSFGMTYGLNLGAPDEVRLLVQAEGIKQ